MKPIFTVIILLFIVSNVDAQENLVPNPSFEDTTQCPFNPAQIAFASPWIDPTNSTPDLFNFCNNGGFVGVPNNIGGVQLARTGNGYAGFETYAIGSSMREYIQVQLDSPLLAGKNYYGEFYVSLSDTSTNAANNMGAYLSSTAITGSSGQVLNYIPQINNNPLTNPLTDKTSWTKISGNFIATGGEDYITIGNFLNDPSTDTTHVNGGSYPAAYYYIDDISVVCLDCDTATGVYEMNNTFHYNLYPNPNNGTMNFNYSLDTSSKGELVFYDVTGKVVANYSLQTGSNNLLSIQEKGLSNGVYFYKAFIDSELKASGKFVIIK